MEITTENVMPKNICCAKDCNRKIKLTDLMCRCGNFYCKAHRLPESHNCTYDFKENDKKKQRIENLKCIGSKLVKI
tara:strand:- start:7795 stop:8022 length:228 start_codon:yes stop_codon:yes gene_type:complete